MKERDQERLRAILAEQRREQFNDGFADRVVARLGSRMPGEGATAGALVRYCRRAIPAAVAAALLLAVHNVVRTRQSSESVIARVLGVTPAAPRSATTAAIVSVESLYQLGPIVPEGE